MDGAKAFQIIASRHPRPLITWNDAVSYYMLALGAFMSLANQKDAPEMARRLEEHCKDGISLLEELNKLI